MAISKSLETVTIVPKRPASGWRAVVNNIPLMPRRRLALLGGTTSLGDCLVALRHLAAPHAMVQGPSIAEYEQAFAQQIGVRHAFSFCAGRVGLYGLLRALGVGEGDEVLLQAPTHIVVANAIRYAGAKPVYVDCRLDDYNMDFDDAERRITPRTKVLLVQHTFGMPADMNAARSLARAHGLDVIEDCVHALGATFEGRQVGSLSRAAFFSTEETKTISSTMGGMVVTDDSELANKMQAFQSSCAWPSTQLTTRYMAKLVLYHLMMEPHAHRYTRAVYELLGQRTPLPRPTELTELRGDRPANYEQRLSNVQAAVALRQLRRLGSNFQHRQTIAEACRTRLSAAGFTVPRPAPNTSPSWVRYPVWVQDRPAAVRATAPHVVLGTWFTSVLEESTSVEAGDYQPGSCPRAESAAQHLVNIPTHPRVHARDVEVLTAALAGARSNP